MISRTRVGMLNVQGTMNTIGEIEHWIATERIHVAVLTETLLDPQKGNPYGGPAECARFAEKGPRGTVKPRGGVSIRLNGMAKHRTVLRIVEANCQAVGVRIGPITYVDIYIYIYIYRHV